MPLCRRSPAVLLQPVQRARHLHEGLLPVPQRWAGGRVAMQPHNLQCRRSVLCGPRWATAGARGAAARWPTANHRGCSERRPCCSTAWATTPATGIPPRRAGVDGRRLERAHGRCHAARLHPPHHQGAPSWLLCVGWLLLSQQRLFQRSCSPLGIPVSLTVRPAGCCAARLLVARQVWLFDHCPPPPPPPIRKRCMADPAGPHQPLRRVPLPPRCPWHALSPCPRPSSSSLLP